MPASLPSIDLELPKKLQDRTYRQAFFLAESSASIAKQLIDLRKRRGLNQTQVAEAIGTGQPAISRVESADYRNWSFNTLRRLAEAMDARLRVYIEPAEDVLREYEAEGAEYFVAPESASAAATKAIAYDQRIPDARRTIVGSAISIDDKLAGPGRISASRMPTIPRQRVSSVLKTMDETHGIG